MTAIPQGIARPTCRATLSAPIQGMLVEVRVAAGEQVHKGQILAVMDNRVASAAVRAAQSAADRTAQIDHARHALTLAESLLGRYTALQAAEAGAEYELEQARAQRDQAQATLAAAMESQEQARRNLELEQARLEQHNLRAPFDGKVVEIEAHVGTTLSTANHLLSLVALDSLEAELHLPLKWFDRLQAGQSYRLWAFEPIDGAVQGKLVFASPVIDTASKTFRCTFIIDNPRHGLPAGFGVRLDIPSPEPIDEDHP